MAFRIIDGRSRAVRRIAVACVAAGVVALGAVVVPSIASASASSDVGSEAQVEQVEVGNPDDLEDDGHKDEYKDDEHKGDVGAPKTDDPKVDDPKVDDPKDDDPKDDDPKDDPKDPKDDGDDNGTGSIRPGAALGVPGAEDGTCTANFVYDAGDRVFLGYAAHCAAVITDPVIDEDYCQQEPFPLGTEIDIEGAESPGTLAYSSWDALQENGVGPGDMCMYNDFALIELSDEDVDNVDPTVPELGGPAGLMTDEVAVGDVVFAYLPNIALPAVKRGLVVAVEPEGLGYTLVTVPPSMPGDSGGPYLDGDGLAFGSLSGGNAATSLVTDLSMALNYAIDFDESLEGLEIVAGEEPFSTDGLTMTPVPDAAVLGDLVEALPLP